jgi:16S rRNA (uracil1498-N3)-methyltransferase
VPEISDPAPLPTAIRQTSEAVRLLLSETEQERGLMETASGQVETLALAVGPEGGWTASEMQAFTQESWTHVTLGPRILRAETAAIAGIAIASAALNRRSQESS